MNFRECQKTGDTGVEVVMRWLAHRNKVFENRMVRTDKGRIAMQLQTTVGDVLYNPTRETVMSIEVKTEREAWPNLFLETYSNADSERLKLGWLFTLDSDWLFYYFMPNDLLCTVDFQRLKTWAFAGKRPDGSSGRIYDFPEKRQRLHRQLNDTRARVVPIQILATEVGLRQWHPVAEMSGAEIVA